ncbi:MAG: Ig domain-containing protein, partial [Bacteroidales bacterium]|nr:Ig domain-containing protein [Bacteroidales bacterium]
VPVESVTLNKTALTLTEGDSETLTATVNPDNATDKTVTWSSSKTSVATVDNGKITAIAEGTATITAKAGEKTATCTVTVKKKEIPVSSISISYESLTLEVGTQKMLTATVTPDNATYKTVNWASSNTSVATVDANGKITAIKAGTTTITAKAGDKSASCIVTVTQPVTSVTLNTSSLILRENETAQLIATVGPQDATDKTVTWTSSNPAIVSVDGNGQIKAISLGNATVTAKAGDVSATCEIKVTNDVAGGSEGFGEEEWD